MKPISLSIALLMFVTLASAVAKPLKVFILAGQSNMEGHAKVETFDYIGDDIAIQPAPFWDEKQQREHLKRYKAKLISPAEEALWKRGASNAGYHYLGCAKTFALMGKFFAEATLKMMKDAPTP